MPWKRRGDRQYFYRSRRVGGRVVAEYVGAGELAELVAAGVECGRASRRAARATERELRQAEREWQEAAERLVSDALGLATWIMQAAGYHRHDRGPWRKRRGTMRRETDAAGGTARAGGASTPAPARPSPPAGPSRGAAEALGWGPDRAALRMLAGRYCGDDAAGGRSRRALIADTEAMARELAGPGPTPLVLVLAEAVAFAWAELRMAQAADHAAGRRTIAQEDAAGRRVDRAHRRFLRASKALSDVQRVSPAVLVQINQQYNLGGESAGPPAEAGPRGEGSGAEDDRHRHADRSL